MLIFLLFIYSSEFILFRYLQKRKTSYTFFKALEIIFGGSRFILFNMYEYSLTSYSMIELRIL
jgi:hypothetical protein